MTGREELLQAYPLMRRLASLWTKNPAAREDIAQEVFVKALAHIDSYEPGTDMKAWLGTIMRNYVVNEYRVPSKVRKLGPDAEGQALVSEYTSGLSSGEGHGAERAHAAEAWRKVASKLRPRYRQLLVLSAVYEWTHAQIAEHLCIPVGTVMSNLWRARAEARALLMEAA